MSKTNSVYECHTLLQREKAPVTNRYQNEVGEVFCAVCSLGLDKDLELLGSPDGFYCENCEIDIDVA